MAVGILIPLGRKGDPVAWALVDEDDYEMLSQSRWYLSNKGYAYRSDSRVPRSDFMHRVIMDAPKGMHVDHISGDKLDNRRGNLQVISCSEHHRVTAARRHAHIRAMAMPLWEGGMSKTAIAVVLGIPRSTLSKIVPGQAS